MGNPSMQKEIDALNKHYKKIHDALSLATKCLHDLAADVKTTTASVEKICDTFKKIKFIVEE